MDDQVQAKDTNISPDLKDKIATAVTILRWELADALGHVSARKPDGSGFYLRHLRPPEDAGIPEDDVIEYDNAGNKVAGRRWGGAGTEIYFYTFPYAKRPDIGGIVHVHPLHAIALTAAGGTICSLSHRHKFGAGVPVCPWLYGSVPEDGEILSEALGDHSAVMIEGHGAVVVGRSLEEACINAVQLEQNAKLILMASAIGKVKPAPTEATEKFRSIVGPAAKSRNMPGIPVLEWMYLEKLVKSGEHWSKL